MTTPLHTLHARTLSKSRHGGQVHAQHDDIHANHRIGPVCAFLRQAEYHFSTNLQVMSRILTGCRDYKLLPRRDREQQDTRLILSDRQARAEPVQDSSGPAFVETSHGIAVPYGAFFASLRGWVLERIPHSNPAVHTARMRRPVPQGIPLIKSKSPPDAAEDARKLDAIKRFLITRNTWKIAQAPSAVTPRVPTSKQQKRRCGVKPQSVPNAPAG